MTRLLLAQEGYHRLSLALANGLNEGASDQAEAWLRGEVCPAVEELILSRRFRVSARWSIDHLAPGVQGTVRQLVEQVDCALVGCAVELLSATVAEGAEEPVDGIHPATPLAVSQSARSALEMLAARPWADLVCAEEYFHAYRDLHLDPDRAPEAQRRWHTEIFRRQQELRLPLGDYVARSMFARIDYWKAVLDQAWMKVFAELPPGPEDEIDTHNRLFSAKMELEQAVAKLVEQCHLNDAQKQCNACSTLTQVYAAYGSSPNLQWLDQSPGAGEAEAGMIRHCVRRCAEVGLAEDGASPGTGTVDTTPPLLCDPTVLRHIASALHDVAFLYEIPDDPDRLIEWVTDRVRLVLVDRFPRVLYWDGVPTDDAIWDDSPNEWNLIWTLARRSQRLVTQDSLSHPERHAIKSRRSRLKTLLSEMLEVDNLIEAARGTGGYQLDLAPGDVCLLQEDGRGGLEVVRRNTSSP